MRREPVNLGDRLRAEIAATGPISVADYMARCLFEGEDAPQRELTSGIIEPRRVAVLRGRVLDDEGLLSTTLFFFYFNVRNKPKLLQLLGDLQEVA